MHIHNNKRMIEYKVTSSIIELEQIIVLQQENLPKSISQAEKIAQGFVTVEHDINILLQMHKVHPHTIALCNGKVVGYALSMSKEFGNSIPVLVPMFKEFEKQRITSNFIVMGQICIAKTHRRQGVFKGLYNKMVNTFANTYDEIITEVDIVNTRSLNAHYATGFRDVCSYEAANQIWKIISLKI